MSNRVLDLYCTQPSPGVVRVYSAPIRYYDAQGTPQDIDETLVQDVDGGWKNETNEIKSYITKRGRVTYTRGQHSAWIEPRYISVDTVPEANRVSQFVRTLNIVKDNHRKARIADIAPNVDIAWEVHSAAIKELIVLKSSNVLNVLPAQATELHMAWDYDLPAVASGSIEENHVVVRAPNNDVVLRVLPVYAEDADGAVVTGQYSIRNGYLLCTLDLDWFRDPARVWPITIDPTVDTGTSTQIRVGHQFGATDIVLLRFPLPSLNVDEVVSANFNWYIPTVSSNPGVGGDYWGFHTSRDTGWATYTIAQMRAITMSTPWYSAQSSVLAQVGAKVRSMFVGGLEDALLASESEITIVMDNSTYNAGTMTFDVGGTVQTFEIQTNSVAYRWNFATHNHATVSYRPYIEITYTEPIRTATGALVTPSATMDGSLALTRKVSAALTTPSASMLASTNYTRLIQGALITPLPMIAGQSFNRIVSGSLTTPSASMSASITLGRHLSGSLVAPSPTLSGNAYLGKGTSAALQMAPISITGAASWERIRYVTTKRFTMPPVSVSARVQKDVSGSAVLTTSVARIASSLTGRTTTFTTSATLSTPVAFITPLVSRTATHVATGSFLTPTVGVSGMGSRVQVFSVSGSLLMPRVSIQSTIGEVRIYTASGELVISVPTIDSTMVKESVGVGALLTSVPVIVSHAKFGRVLGTMLVPVALLNAVAAVERTTSAQLVTPVPSIQTTVYLPVKTATGALTTIPVTLSASSVRQIVAAATLGIPAVLLSGGILRTVVASAQLQTSTMRVFTQVVPLPSASAQWYRVTKIQRVPGTRFKRITLTATKRPTGR